MDATQENLDRSATAQQLSHAVSLAEAGNYGEALNVIRQVKNVEPRNIYILAFERQIEQLVEFSDQQILTDEQRSDILESIPGIIERAMDTPGTSANEPSADDIRRKEIELQKEKEEKAAALQWLRDQYFQHAHDYVANEEYRHALAEIRRVFIIDPDNRTAKDFEHHIEELAAIQAIRLSTQRPGQAGSTGKASPTADQGTPVADATEPSEFEKGILAKEKRGRMIRIVVMSVLALLVALAIWFVATRSKAPVSQAPAEKDGLITAVVPATTVR